MKIKHKLILTMLIIFSSSSLLAKDSPIHFDAHTIDTCYIKSSSGMALDCSSKSAFISEEFLNKACYSYKCQFTVTAHDPITYRIWDAGSFFYEKNIQMITTVLHTRAPYQLFVNGNNVSINKTK